MLIYGSREAVTEWKLTLVPAGPRCPSGPCTDSKERTRSRLSAMHIKPTGRVSVCQMLLETFLKCKKGKLTRRPGVPGVPASPFGPLPPCSPGSPASPWEAQWCHYSGTTGGAKVESVFTQYIWQIYHTCGDNRGRRPRYGNLSCQRNWCSCHSEFY